LPTNKPIVINGKEEAPKPKFKLPLDVDWQKIAKEKQGK